MFGNQTPVRSFSSTFGVRGSQLPPVRLLALIAPSFLWSPLRKLPVKKDGSANFWKFMMTSYSCNDTFDLRRVACACLCFPDSRLRKSTSTNDYGTDGKRYVEGGENSGSLSTLSAFFNSFSRFAQMKFVTGRTNRDNVRARLVKASMNVEDFFHFSVLRLNLSSNVPSWTIPVETVSKA